MDHEHFIEDEENFYANYRDDDETSLYEDEDMEEMLHQLDADGFVIAGYPDLQAMLDAFNELVVDVDHQVPTLQEPHHLSEISHSLLQNAAQSHVSADPRLINANAPDNYPEDMSENGSDSTVGTPEVNVQMLANAVEDEEDAIEESDIEDMEE